MRDNDKKLTYEEFVKLYEEDYKKFVEYIIEEHKETLDYLAKH